MKLSDYIIHFFEEKGIKYIFGYIGGAITHLTDSANKSNKLKYIQVYHEQTAAIAAEGYSRNSNKMGVAIATSGPGATNLITGIADAYFDSIPAIYITGQVNTYEYKYEKPIRQQGFQEMDVVSIVKPITKYAALIDNAANIKYELEKAFFLAQNGRQGPVLLDIPMDIQRAEIDINSLKSYVKEDERHIIEIDKIQQVITMIKSSNRPMILAGGGVLNSKAHHELEQFILKTNIPIVTSLLGKGSFPEDHELFQGMIGSYGNRCANIALANTDLLIAIGTRLDTRQTGTLLKSFLRSGKIIHVDIDQNELDCNRLKRDLKINANIKTFLEELNKQNTDYKCSSEWIKYLAKVKKSHNQKMEIDKFIQNKLPYQIMEVLNKYSSSTQIFTADIGQNQMFSAQMLQIKKGQKFFTSGGLAPMGYSISCAIGASFACDHKEEIFAIIGDGGFHMSTQALMLISQYNLPIKIIVLNNSSLGMIVQFQDLYFDAKHVGTTYSSGYQVPDFSMLANAYSLKYFMIDNSNIDDENKIKSIFSSNSPCIIEVKTDEKTIVSPKLEVNTPIEDVNPKLDRKILNDYMLIDLYENNNLD